MVSLFAADSGEGFWKVLAVKITSQEKLERPHGSRLPFCFKFRSSLLQGCGRED